MRDEGGGACMQHGMRPLHRKLSPSAQILINTNPLLTGRGVSEHLLPVIAAERMLTAPEIALLLKRHTLIRLKFHLSSFLLKYS